jgi:hypothetical protein
MIPGEIIMTRNEVISKIATDRQESQYFIKLFKTGHKLVDFDLIDEFVSKRDQSGEIDEFELLDMEQMWQTLIDLDPDKLTRSGSSGNETIEWCWVNSEGAEKTSSYPFTPEGIMNIVNDDFFA